MDNIAKLLFIFVPQWKYYDYMQSIDASRYELLNFAVLNLMSRFIAEILTMGRKRKPESFEKVEITGIAAGGKAIAKIEGMVVFVPFAAPGDIADITFRKKKKKHAEGTVDRFHSYSPLRAEPFCSHFGICGGCKWQHITYTEQLKFKQQQVVDNLERIGKMDIPAVNNILPSPKTTFYRNKLEYTFSSIRWLTREEIESGEEIKETSALGFHIPGRFDKVLDIKKCYLQKDPSNQIRLEVKKYAVENGIPFFHLRKQEGLLRNLIIRTSSTGDVMVIVVFSGRDERIVDGLLSHLRDTFPEITSLLYVINPKANDTINDLDAELFHGKDHITERMEDLEFMTGPKSFFQTNPCQAYNLYKVVRDFASPQKHEVIYDLYTGTGTIANFIARDAGKVTGIEYVQEAIDYAVLNSDLNGIGNTNFFAGDIRRLLSSEFVEKNGAPHTVILDPPRTGIHKDIAKKITEIKPSKIVYVSCNPSTQSRDLQILSEHYKIVKVQPVDMFPHTHHVENVVLCEPFM